MIKSKLLVLALITILSGCQPILLMMYGIKNPDIENEKSIIKKAHKFNLDTDNIVTVNGKDFLLTLKGKGIPDCDVFDKNGNYIEYRETDTSCNAGLFNFIPALALNQTYKMPKAPNLQTTLAKCRNLKGDVIQPTYDADFYVLIYWTVWTGKLNKDHVKIWEDQARNNKNCKVRVIKVNMDMQEYWDKSDRDVVIEAMKKR